VVRALAKDPADRVPDGGAFAEAIRRVAAGGTLAPAPVGPSTAPTQVVGDRGLADQRTTILAAQPGALTGTRALSPATGPAGPMPPLHGPDDEDHWPAEDVGTPPHRANRSRWLWLVAALVVLLTLGGGTALLLSGGNGNDQDRSADPTGTPTGTSASATGVTLKAAGAYVGRDADEVTDELEGLGLTVVQEPADDELLTRLGLDLDENAVASIMPVGTTVPTGAKVTLTVAEDGWTVEDEEQEEPAPAPESEEPTTAPTTTRPTTTAPTTTAPTTTASATPTVPTPTAPTQSGQPGEDTGEPTGTPTGTGNPQPVSPEAAAPGVTG
jgi:hypothetical protein